MCVLIGMDTYLISSRRFVEIMALSFVSEAIWVPPDSLDGTKLPLPKSTFEHWLETFHDPPIDRSPWAKVDWYTKAHKWILDQCKAGAIDDLLSITQIRVTPFSMILRLREPHGTFFLKSTSTLYSLEPNKTRYLHTLFPSLVPDVVALHPGSESQVANCANRRLSS